MELLRCPISMEIMEDPVTIATGITYERNNIERWLFTYKSTTCPATMLPLPNFVLTPNHTLKRLISSLAPAKPPPCLSNKIDHEKLVFLLNTIDTTPFKVSSLKKLKCIVDKSDEARREFLASGGIEVLGRTMSQSLAADMSTDEESFPACEEVVGVLSLLQLSPEDPAKVLELMLKPEFLKPLTMILQRGSSEARIHAISIFMNLSKSNEEWPEVVAGVQGNDVFQSLLELLLDETSTPLSSSSLDLLLELVASSKKNRLKAIKVGAVCILIELLPDTNRWSCEKVLMMLKRLCQLPEGRLALADHGLGIAAVSKKAMRVSETATKLAVKILWLMSSFLPSEKVIEDMMAFGSVKKLMALLQFDHNCPSVKEMALKMIKIHASSWQKYPCFPTEKKDFFMSLMQECWSLVFLEDTLHNFETYLAEKPRLSGTSAPPILHPQLWQSTDQSSYHLQEEDEVEEEPKPSDSCPCPPTWPCNLSSFRRIWQTNL